MITVKVNGILVSTVICAGFHFPVNCPLHQRCHRICLPYTRGVRSTLGQGKRSWNSETVQALFPVLHLRPSYYDTAKVCRRSPPELTAIQVRSFRFHVYDHGTVYSIRRFDKTFFLGQCQNCDSFWRPLYVDPGNYTSPWSTKSCNNLDSLSLVPGVQWLEISPLKGDDSEQRRDLERHQCRRQGYNPCKDQS